MQTAAEEIEQDNLLTVQINPRREEKHQHQATADGPADALVVTFRETNVNLAVDLFGIVLVYRNLLHGDALKNSVQKYWQCPA
ncbi:hypothetical protein [Aliamphritea spongicola]